MALPRDILESVDRVLDFHEQTKLEENGRRPAAETSARPPAFRELPASAVVPLTKKLVDLPTAVVELLSGGLEAVPPSLHHPPQDLRTLSTWLHMAVGYRPAPGRTDANPLMAYPTGTGLPPGDIYVAASAIAGLEPGLYQFVPRLFALRRIRDGIAPLQVLRRGRPDLQFLASVPASLLVSSIFCRTSSRLGRRGYRQSLLDCGHIVANLHATAMALGINTMTRLRLTESNTRELIGLTEETPYPFMEAVHAAVVWAEGSQQPTTDPAHRPPHRPLRGAMLDPSTGAAAMLRPEGTAAVRNTGPDALLSDPPRAVSGAKADPTASSLRRIAEHAREEPGSEKITREISDVGNRPVENRLSDDGSANAGVPEGRPADGGAAGDRSTVDQSVEDRSTEERAREDSAREDRPTGDRTTEDRAAEDRSTEAVIQRALSGPGRQLPPIERPGADSRIASFGSIVAAHLDSVARGVAIREIRPPLTDMSPLPSNANRTTFPYVYDVQHSHALRDVLLRPECPDAFAHKAPHRDLIVRLARLAFRGGTFFPLKPAGQHLALVRPFFVINDVVGMEAGIWYYDPVSDCWSHLNVGRYRTELARLAVNKRAAGEAAVMCLIVANLRATMQNAGPDLHRIAHLEAGVAAQRLNLVAQSMDLSALVYGSFYDNLCKQFLGLGATNWEPLVMVAMGYPIHEIDEIEPLENDAVLWKANE